MSKYKVGDKVSVRIPGSPSYQRLTIDAVGKFHGGTEYLSGKRYFDESEILEPPAGEPVIPASDAVNHPAHYGGDTTYEVIKVIDAWGLSFSLGNLVKYVARAGKKDPSKELEDLRKGRFYLDHRIKQLEEQSK